MTTALTDTSVPRFPRGVRLRLDDIREAWIVLAPERVFVPDEHALAVLNLVDGARDVGAIIATLAETFATPAAIVGPDVHDMLAGLANRGAITW